MSNFYKEALENIEKFFLIEKSDNAANIFSTLKDILDFDSAYIFYLSPNSIRLEYSYNSKLNENEYDINEKLKNNLFSDNDTDINELIKVLKISSKSVAEKLKIRKNVYGIIILTRIEAWSFDEKKVFKTYSTVISSLIKDIEMTKIMQIQTLALQEGIVETDNAYKIIKSQNKKILAADKIKNKFLANVSHELRTPLNSIIGFSELLQNKSFGLLNEKQKEYVNDIQISGIHLLGMINEILDISKLEAQSMKLSLRKFDLKENIREVLNILTPFYNKKNIEIINNSKSIIIEADYQKIQQILFNLINNAIKYTPNNGNITINTENTKKYFIISIKDTGCGIAKEFHKKIFKKFEQIKPMENSTGLGLTITKELVKMHKGSINITSNEGEGAEFIIKIPFKQM